MTLSKQKHRPAGRIQGFGTTIFAEMTALALQYEAVNLGQGFPNFPCPDFLKEAAAGALHADLNQYARSAGLPHLVQVLAKEMSPSFGRELDPLAEITITSGATEGLFIAAQAFLEADDEIVLLEPFYDAFPANAALCGAKAVYVPLKPDDSGCWSWDAGSLENAFSKKTKMVIINSPHNPTGKVFTRPELEQLAALCIHYDTIVVSDEVYDRMIFDDASHLRIASLPGMWERTITLGSAGKTFSVTGWKIGWAIAPSPFSEALRKVHQWVSYAVSTPLQEAVAAALAESEPRGYYPWLKKMYQGKRDLLIQGLNKSGFQVYQPKGTYFILCDFSAWQGTYHNDTDFCKYLTAEVGVAAIPPSFFYSEPNRGLAKTLVRFCFCKTDETLIEATRKLQEAFNKK